MSHQITEAIFLADIASHCMHVLRDDGIYRHLRFKRPDSSTMYFDLVTWPGHLAYTGDMGNYMFARLEDMFEFFRTDRQFGANQGSGLGINPGYWSEKVLAVDAAGGDKAGAVKKFDRERFDRVVIGNVVQWFREHKGNTTKDERRALWEAFVGDVIEASSPMDAALSFSHQVNRDAGTFFFEDLWETSMTDFTPHFIWACYAIAWGVAQYDEYAKARVASSHITPSAGNRRQDAHEFVRVTEKLLASIEESPEILARVEVQMKRVEDDMAKELLAAVVGRDFMKRGYTL